MVKSVKKKPDIILRNGKPISVILDLDEYQEILEEMRKNPLIFI